jgi:biofilm PGA synthesis N-glycosyltransferase PgaC
MTTSASIFWVCALLLAYVYVGYPALVWAWGRLRPRPVRPQPISPEVTILVVAHNEAERIRSRLENLLALDYPREQLEIVLASDGSTDDTAERAREYEPAGVTVIAFETRRGKSAVLDDLVPKARGEIVVLADARQTFDTSALRALVAPFADAGVGAVSGELILSRAGDGALVGEGVGAYWRYEKFVRRYESRVDSTVGATGAIYAIRRELFERIPDDTLLDDVMIPIRIVRRGYRVLFEPDARAWDRVAASAGEEFRRKVRTLAGNFQVFAREPWLLNPFRNRLWIQVVSHKGLRLLGPLLLAAAFGANLGALDSAVYRWTLVAQLVFYTAALAGFAVRNAGRTVPLLSLPYVFCLLNCATIVGFLRFVRRRQHVTWQMAGAARR